MNESFITDFTHVDNYQKFLVLRPVLYLDDVYRSERTNKRFCLHATEEEEEER